MTARIFTLFLLVLISNFITFRPIEIESEAASPHPQLTSAPTVTLRAASGAAIEFVTQNGRPRGQNLPQSLGIPHLVLYRNGELTDPSERTLIVEVSGIEVPPTGVTLVLEVETQHGDPDLSGDRESRISIWRATQQLTNTAGFTQTGVTAIFTYQFKDSLTSGTGKIATPTDYMRYDFAVMDTRYPDSSPLHAINGDFALLLENQWVAGLPEVEEESIGAAPDELVVYFCDMFPFQKSIHDKSTWVPREAVPDYIRTEIVPRMVEAISIQTDVWGFPWYRAWTSYRPEEPERLSVALTDGQTWFHGRAPGRGHSGISINVKGGENASYDTLTDGLMSTFHHELFHNLQRNLAQKSRGSKDVNGQGDAWDFFIEGTAVLASSVGQPVVQLAKNSETRAYISKANYFIGGDGTPGELNRSYEKISPYHAAIYWRFLYEQCGGMKNGIEKPAAGMQIIRRALIALYSTDIVDISYSTNLVAYLPGIMDMALKSSLCPFTTYEESLIAFAQSIYALRLGGGRCIEPGLPDGCGFYDPHGVYRDPQIKTITYTGTASTYSDTDQIFPAGINSSFGMDFVDVELDPTTDGQSLTVEFYSDQWTEAEFDVQIWTLIDSDSGISRPRVTSITATEKILARGTPDGQLVYVIPEIDLTNSNRLGMVITRIDAKEGSDPIGAYSIVLRP